MGEVCLGVKGDSLVTRVIAYHVALATINAHVLVDNSNHLLGVVKVTIGSDIGKRLSNHVLGKGRRGRGGGGGGRRDRERGGGRREDSE